MTHTTEQERATFEAWARDRYPSIDLTRDRNDYAKALAKDYWSLWQAARRAPSAPVSQWWKLVPAVPTFAMLDAMHGVCSEIGKPMQSKIDAAYRKYASMLAAAPQPPEAAQLDDTNVVDMAQAVDSKEAAPVQLPEPVAVMTDTTPREPGWKTIFVPDAGTKLYTEQQVRQLLAAHGIKEQST